VTYLQFDGTSGYRIPEDFDPFIRLGHAFAKTADKTAVADVEASIRVREEDVAHDREQDRANASG